MVAQGFSLGFDFFQAVLSLNCASRVGVPVAGGTNLSYFSNESCNSVHKKNKNIICAFLAFSLPVITW